MASSETVFLNNDELYLLVAAKGVEEWFGPFCPQNESIGRQEEVNRIAADLYNKNFLMLDLHDDGNVDPLVAEAISTVADSDVCILLMKGKDKEVFYNYPKGQNIVRMVDSLNDRQTMRVTMMDIDEWKEDLLAKNLDVLNLELRSKSDGSILETVSTMKKAEKGFIKYNDGDSLRTEEYSTEAFIQIIGRWIGEKDK